jgi:D-alanyl-lipoteichoic acid acyltransferase DltB (MBOAT superfamily)
VAIQSASFLLFFGLVFCVSWTCPARVRWAPLLLASLCFVGVARPADVVPLVAAVAVTYAIALRLAGLPRGAAAARKRWVLLGAAVLIGGLAGGKYLNFLGGTVTQAAALFGASLPLRPVHLLLPLGISFYTFRLLGYLIDVYHGRVEAERHAGYFALFAAFFPQVSAGPIERARDFLPRLRSPERFDADRLASGAAQVAWGLFKKAVIANRLAIFVDQVFAAPPGQGLNLVVAAWLYAIQIYCDFSGYTDIAIGLARLLGYESAKNFDAPYASRSVADFWTRWHMSLSFWFRDYLFLPLSYAATRRERRDTLLGVRIETLGYVQATAVTMVLCGLWHGASWSFVAWGGLHALFLIAGQVTRRLRRRWARRTGLAARPWLHHSLQVVVTFNLVSFAWIFFRAPTLAGAMEYLHFMQIKPSANGVGHLVVDCALAAAFLLAEWLYRTARPVRPLPLPVRAGLLAAVACAIVLFGVDSGNEFIYVRF